jgi:small subunit ribosomal protein S1
MKAHKFRNALTVDKKLLHPVFCDSHLLNKLTRVTTLMDIENNDTEEHGEESFAQMFEQSFKDAGPLEPGEKVTVKVLKISGDWIFLDTGRKGEGVLEKKELLDAEGNLTVKEGDSVTAWFLSSHNNEMRFTTRIGGGGGGGGNAALEDAWRTGIPVDGFVEKEVKGGFEVKIGGSVRAFCPFSQIGLRRVEDNTIHIGKHLSFKIMEYAENGRNIVLSHRAILEEEQQRQKEQLKETLKVGAIVHGTVTSLRDFGAFVSIGSIEGLLPISEIGWGRVTDIREALKVGQELEVLIKQLDWENNKFSFSLKDTLANPWDKVIANFPEGSYHNGRVARLTTFGAFVTLGEGVDGLIHISKLGSGKRIQHPREVVKEGESVEVKVEGIDRENRRISLSLAAISRAAEEEEQTMESFRRTAEEAPKAMGTLGDILKARLEKGSK